MITGKQREEIKNYLVNERGIVHYTINDDGTVDAHHDIFDDLSFIKWGRITGNFSCYDSQLTSLIGAPCEVSGGFDCTNNKLRTLEGGPKIVGAHYACSYNKLTSLKGGPQVVGSLNCARNDLISLEGAPMSMEKDFRGDLANLLAVYDVAKAHKYPRVILFTNKGSALKLAAADFSLPKSEFIELMIERGFEDYL